MNVIFHMKLREESIMGWLIGKKFLKGLAKKKSVHVF